MKKRDSVIKVAVNGIELLVANAGRAVNINVASQGKDSSCIAYNICRLQV